MPNPGKTRIALALEPRLLQQGGIEVLVRELIRRLHERFEIVLVSGDRTREALGSEFSALVVAHIPWDGSAPMPQTAAALAIDLRDHQVALVHFHGAQYEWAADRVRLSPIYYLLRAGVPCLLTNHLVSPLLAGYCRSTRPTWQKALLLPRAWFNRAIILRGLRTEVLVSRRDHAYMRRLFSPFKGKFRQLYHSKLGRGEEGLPPAQRQKIIVCLGTFCERKGQALLARAFASIAELHPEWILRMIGRYDTQDYFKQVQKFALDSGFPERIQIFPAQEDPRPALQSAAVFALPSLNEGLPLSLQEALYYGCACVASNVGGVPELIEHEKTGLLVAPGDESALASGLHRLLSNRNLRAQFSRAGQERIVEKGMLGETMAENYAQLYDEILSGKKQR